MRPVKDHSDQSTSVMTVVSAAPSSEWQFPGEHTLIILKIEYFVRPDEQFIYNTWKKNHSWIREKTKGQGISAETCRKSGNSLVKTLTFIHLSIFGSVRRSSEFSNHCGLVIALSCSVIHFDQTASTLALGTNLSGDVTIKLFSPPVFAADSWRGESPKTSALEWKVLDLFGVNTLKISQETDKVSRVTVPCSTNCPKLYERSPSNFSVMDSYLVKVNWV